MLKLYLSGISNIISTLLIIGFGVLFGMTTARRNGINHWGVLVLVVFFTGLLMSMMSGMKDNMSTPTAIFQTGSMSMIILCILGGLCFIIGIIMIFLRRQDFWQIGFYMLSSIIIIKILLVESIRVITYLNKI